MICAHMKPYTKHPVLINPTRWLKPPIRQSHEHYISVYPKDIETNAFAQSLSRTHKESASYRFPNGCLIALVPETKPLGDGSKKKTQIVLSPQFHFDPTAIQVMSYVLNNRKYLEFMDHQKRQWKRYVPIKYKNYNKTVPDTVTTVPHISNVYREFLENSIQKELTALKDSKLSGPGIHLVTLGDLIQFGENEIKFNIPNINANISVPHTCHQLCANIVSLVFYNL